MTNVQDLIGRVAYAFHVDRAVRRSWPDYVVADYDLTCVAMNLEQVMPAAPAHYVAKKLHAVCALTPVVKVELVLVAAREIVAYTRPVAARAAWTGIVNVGVADRNPRHVAASSLEVDACGSRIVALEVGQRDITY